VSGYPLPRPIGRRQARSRSVRSSGNGKEGRSDQLYPVSDAEFSAIRVVWGVSVFVGGAYAEGRVVGRRRESRIMGYGSHPCGDGAGASSNGWGDDADVGRVLVSLGGCFQ
jgi:hypothetical protein